MKTSIVRISVAALVVAALILGIGVSAYAQDPISPPPTIPPQPDARPVPFFIGHEAVAKPIVAPTIPHNPFMAPDEWSAIHDDTYMSDTYVSSGPLGHNPIVSSVALGTQDKPFGLTASVVVDNAGLWVVSYFKADPTLGEHLPGGTVRQRWELLVLVDPDTLEILAGPLELPKGPVTERWDFPPGGYWYRDNQDRIVTATPVREIWVISHTYTPPYEFTIEHKYNLTGYIPEGDNIQAMIPDFSGRMWFTSKQGVVGVLDTEASNGDGEVLGSLQLGDELIENGSAADETGGVYVGSSQAMYRFDFDADADANGEPSITWRMPYDSGPPQKSISLGSGTTPTLMGQDYVTIADNAEPQIHVNVYRRAKDIGDLPRLVCSEPVFEPGQGVAENSLAATDRSIIVENNFGYTYWNRIQHGSTTKPGFARIDIDEDGNGCHTVWTNMEESAPIITPKLSLANGLFYTYTKPKGPANTDAWYFTAIDFETGQTVYKVLAGTGPLFNAHMTVVYLLPDQTAFIGVFGGFVTIRDGP